MSENNGVYYVDDTPLEQSDIDKVNRLVDQGQYSTAGKIISDFLKTKKYGKPTRGALSLWAENMGNTAGKTNDTADDAKAIAQDTQKRFDAQINGQNKDNEAKDARISQADGKTYNVLKDRLDAMDKKPQQAVDNIQVGGRNLIISSDLVNGWIDDLGNLTGGGSDNPFTTGIIDTGSNQDITITKAGKVVVIGEYDTDKKFIKKNRIENPDMYYTFKTGKETEYIRVTFSFSKKDYGTPYKIEKGNKATDWTPAPEDNHHHQAFRKGTRFFAHRGAQSIAPENSLPAIQKAGNHAGVEIDIHVTSDGKWVVMHDGTVDRTTDGTGAISSFTFANLRKLKLKDTVGSRIVKFSDNELVIPTLEEALVECKNQQLIPVVEIKVDDSDNYTSDDYNNLTSIIKKYGVEDEMMFISFDYKALQEVKKRMPLIEVSYLVHTINDDVVVQAQQLGVNSGIDSNYTASGVNLANIKKAHDAGLKVGVWTLADDSQRTKLIGMGVDFITTNSLSGERRWAQLSYRSSYEDFVNNQTNYRSVVQEVSAGIVNVQFILQTNIPSSTPLKKGTPFATLPSWAVPNYRLWNQCMVRTSTGFAPATFDIEGNSLLVGFDWDKKSTNGWVAGNVTYHV